MAAAKTREELQAIDLGSLREVDATIVKVAGEAAERLKAGGPLWRMDEDCRFLGVLLRRRNVILSNFREHGGNVRMPYSIEAALGEGVKDADDAGNA